MAETDWSNFNFDQLKLPNLDIGSPTELSAGLDASSFNWQAPTAKAGGIPNLDDAASLGDGKPSWQTKWLGGTDANGLSSKGIIPVGMQAFSGLTSAYLGWQQFNLAKDQLAQNKKIFNLNFSNQAQNINRDLEDRQRARVASNAGAYQSVGDYMNKNSVSGKGL